MFRLLREVFGSRRSSPSYVSGRVLFAALGMILLGPLSLWAGESSAPDFDRQVRPILSDNCYVCHGPDAGTRKADLRLDAIGETIDAGYIVPGSREDSEVFRRITSEDASERMPPPSTGKTLTPQQIEIIGRWIDSGAEAKPHWSFVPPSRPDLPDVGNSDWCRNPIDRFILARLESEGLGPSPEADKPSLIRRVTLDLTGLPPTPEEVDAFLADDAPDAYEKLVDRLLASPRYGEHMARHWLDVARYGDTHGLHLDNYRSIWPYRDWVIQAFNRNQSFDRFIVDQLAGDLVPDGTLEQKVASGFNRCNVTTSEGGAIDAEFLVRYAVDRTSTVGTAFLGLTVGCAVCHDHKYDPISQKEFYSLYAYFYSMADPAMDGNAMLTPPVVKLPTPEQATTKAALEAELQDVRAKIADALAKIEYADPEAELTAAADLSPREIVWVEDELPPEAQPQFDGHPWEFAASDEHPVFSGTKSFRRKADGQAQHFFTGAKPTLTVGEGDVLFAYVFLDPADPPREIMLQFNDGSWEHRAYWGENVIAWGADGTASRFPKGELPPLGEWVRLEVPVAEVGLKPGSQINGWAFTQHGGTVYWDHAGIVTKTPQAGERYRSLRRWELVLKETKAGRDGVPKPILDILDRKPEDRDEAAQKQLQDYFVEYVFADARETFDPLHASVTELEEKLKKLDGEIVGTLVSADLPQPREAFLLDRGDYEKPKDKVEPGTPAVLPPMPADYPRNRLGLARWLVLPDHPLTARVTVNRFWQQVFGTGLVKTAEDFGSQGERPSHPELLDWLAVDFVENGWDVKRLMRMLVTSSTYRQTARVTPELLAKDPDNRLLARGPRFRLDAEAIRDTALFASGLLVEKIGGPSVKPYQPAGLWEAVGYTTSNTAKFVQDHGESLYRRSLYTFWKRTSPPPGLVVFDAPNRESCVVRRPRTNTPLQALALMNDVGYVEAARKMAERLLRDEGTPVEERVAKGFRWVTSRYPRPEETAVLTNLLQWQHKYFEEHPAAAEELLRVGEAPREESLPQTELAAWTMVCNALLNLDETITK